MRRCFTLPHDGFTYGKANEGKDSGAADGIVLQIFFGVRKLSLEYLWFDPLSFEPWNFGYNNK